MIIPFAKYHGAGNDFILVDDRVLKFPVADEAFIVHMCQHRLGIGADGLILLQPSELADFRMRIFNADGKEAEMCGNGLRCLVDFIRQDGFKLREVSIETQGRIVQCTWKGDKISVDLGSYEQYGKPVKIEPYTLHMVNTGVPHAVAFVETLEHPQFTAVASKIRSHPALGPEGANVNFAQFYEGKIYTRTYERGVEDETLACGTGAAAVAIAAVQKYGLKNPVCIVPASQEELFVEVHSDRVHLLGQATLVFIGSIVK